MRLIGFLVAASLLLHAGYCADAQLAKRAITHAPPRRDEIEGSGAPPSDAKGGSADTDGRKQHGYSPDDEDSIEGSGRPPVIGGGKTASQPPLQHQHEDADDEDAIEGSGGRATGVSDISRHDVEVHQPAAHLTTTSTTTEATPATRRIWEVETTEAPRIVVQPTTTTTRRPELLPTQRPGGAQPPAATEGPIFPFHGMLKPGIFAAVVGGTVVGLLMAILLVMFIVYRMRKRDEGSYALEEPKQRQYAGYAYTKANNTKEFYA